MKRRPMSSPSSSSKVSMTRGHGQVGNGILKIALAFLFLAGCEAYGPGFAGEPPSLVLYSNLTGLVLDCLARGEPPPIIDWVDENGNLLSLSPNFARRLENGSLHFLPLAYESSRHPGYEETRIRCRASNPYGIIVSKIISVKPVLLNQVSVRVMAEPVLKFNTAVLRCQVPQNAALYTKIQSWQRGNTIIYPTSKGDGKYHVVPSGDLHVLRSDLSDTSVAYVCRVKNILTGLEETSPPFQLTVQDDLSVPTKPKELAHQDLYYSVRQEEPAVLACNVQSNPPPAFSWFRVRNNLLEPLSLTSRLHLSAGILVIEHSQLEDSGQYRCTARNERGEVNLIMNLDVSTDISVDVNPSEQIIDIGRQARLECLTENKNGLTITWMKDGLPLANHRRIVTSSQHILEIFNLQREDYGMYQCFVSRGAQEAQASSELRLGDASPVMSYRFIDQTLQPGPPVSLKCSARGSPTPQVSWTLHGFPLPKTDRFLIGQYVTVHGEVVSHVNISRVEVEDGGLYACIVENRAGTARHEGRLNIYGPPYVHPIPELKAVVGKEFSFMCPASGYPIDRISWSKDNVGLPLEHRQRVFDNGTLVISKVTRKDAGSYSCTATDRSGTSSTQSGTIKVIVAPVVESFTFPKNLTRGKRLRAVCTVTEGDLPIDIEWRKDGVTLLPDVTLSGPKVRRIDEYTSLLAISSLDTVHAGNYSCLASNAVAEVAKWAVLTIRVPPEWIVKPQDQAAVEGQDVVFQCRVAGIPLPTVTWRKLDKNDGTNSRRTLMELNYQRPVYRNYRLLSNGSLLIEHASEEDEGRLMCEADNGVNEPLVKIVNLNINAPPKFVVAHSGPVTGRTKEAVDLVCEAVGDDHISIKWLKEGKDYLTLPGKSSTTEIRELERVTSKLKIVDAEKDDGGRYSCQATNAFGSSHFTVDVTIWEPPPTPDNLTILEITSRSVKVSWALESTSPVVDRIVIQWKEHSEEWYPEGKQNIQAGHLKEALVPSLNPWTVYHLRLFAENQLGKSKEGKVLQFLTHGEKPSGPPRNVRITGLSSTSLEVTWDDPEKRLMHGPVTRYSLGYREYNSQNYRFVDVDKADYGDDPAGNSCRFIIGRLRKFTKYEIIIRAINGHGEGPLSRPSVGQTQEDAPDGAPEKVHCVALTSSTIQVSWHPTEIHLRNGIIKGYKVLYAPHPGLTPVANLPLPKVSRLSTVTTVLDGLRKFSNYSIQVAAFTAAGDGKFSNIITCATHTDVPGPPKGVKAVIKSPRSVIVSWLLPEQPNGVVERYHIYLRRIHPHVVDRSHNKYTRPADVRWITIEDLEPDRQYQFWVTAVTNAGEGLSSNVVTQTPSSRVPAAIATMDEEHYLALGSELTMDCRYAGEPTPNKKWFFNAREEGWLAQRSLFADTEMDIPNLSKEHEGNYTCYVENSIGTDSVTHRVVVQEPPKSPSVHIVKTTPTSIGVRWRMTDDGNSPISKVILNYKMTYGEWADQEVVWHKQEESLTNLHCGREYHVYVVIFNAFGASPASQVLTTRTLGSRPTGPTESEDFIVANTTFLSLRLDLWRDNRCDILYFVVEYKHDSSDVWTTVTNDLQPQMRYSIRGLTQNTNYELKVTAHNHAGSTTLRYSVATLAENQSGAAPYENGTSHITNVFMGLGVRSILLIIVSSLCLVLSSIGVCVCLRKKHSPHVGMRYGEIPKSCTMENRQNIEHQLYATIQRKQPPVPPFTGATNVSKGFDTIDRLKMVRGIGETRMSTGGVGGGVGGGPSNGAGNEAPLSLPQSGTTLCPYASSAYYQSTLKAGPGRCATLGRIKTLEMTECQKMKMMNEANNAARGTKDSKEYTLSLGRSHKLRRKPYSESEEYDTDSSGDRGDLSSRAESSNQLSRQQVPVPAVSRYTGLKYRQHFNL